MAIKIKIGKLKLQMDLEYFIGTSVKKFDLEFLNIRLSHFYYTQQLPFHHRDPFDRLLIAQALSENILFISSDIIFDGYV